MEHDIMTIKVMIKIMSRVVFETYPSLPSLDVVKGD
jgi:hypothetical protein